MLNTMEVDSKGFCQWRVTLGTTGFLDTVHRQVLSSDCPVIEVGSF
jgi:hypothetical protein